MLSKQYLAEKVFPGWRVSRKAASRVKAAAKLENISANEYVDRLILNSTQGIETDEEREIRLAGNKDFLDNFAGKWAGKESAEDILESIKSSRTTKKALEL